MASGVLKTTFTLLLLLSMLACAPVKSAESSAQVDQSDDTKALPLLSALVFEPNRVDMGVVKEGEDAVIYVQVRNSGNVMANIVAVETSCGCSVAEPEQHLLMPGAFTRMKVIVDTFAKQGQAKKWVSLTDHLGRRSTLWLTLQVQANPHLEVSSRSIFKGKCAACHFDAAKGQTKAKDIYQAVCSMCHGDKQQGLSAPSLLHHHNAEILNALIARGTGSHHMPGFALNQGGPLTEKQISTLSQWLSRLDETDQNR